MKPLLYAITLLVAFLGGDLQAEITADLAISEGGTSIGTITLELDHVNAPMATANFIGLASGEFAWIDSTTGAVRKEPYYDGAIFHRVIAGFMNQTGTQNGDGTEGPGYAFPDGDEVSNGLNHSEAFVVSMANSGTNSNGSQFFITVVPKSELDGIHIVFGKAAVASQALITYINNVPVVDADGPDNIDGNNDDLDIPVTEIKIDSVTVNLNGALFDIHAQGLPMVSDPSATMAQDGSLFELNVEQPSASLTKYFHSTTLTSWQSGGEVYHDENAEAKLKIDVSSLADGKDKLFFYTSQISYDTSSPLWPSSLSGRVLSIEDTLLASQYASTWVFTFTSNDGGTVVNGAQSGTFTVDHYGSNWLAGREYLKTNMKYSFNGQDLDINFFLRMTQNQHSATHFTGIHKGTVYLTQNGTTSATGPTSGTMTLTR